MKLQIKECSFVGQDFSDGMLLECSRLDQKKVALCCAPVPASNDQSILASTKLDEAGHSTGENRKQS